MPSSPAFDTKKRTRSGSSSRFSSQTVVLKMTARPSPRALEVLLAHLVELPLGREALPLLRDVDVEGDVDEADRAQLGEEIARAADAVGEERRIEPDGGDVADDLDQLVAAAQRRIAAGDLHVGLHAEEALDVVGLALELVERRIGHALGIVGQVAERAVEVAALRDLERDAAGGGAPAEDLPRRAVGRLEAVEFGVEQAGELGVLDGRGAVGRRLPRAVSAHRGTSGRGGRGSRPDDSRGAGST
jgi:hypothetical protein